MTATGRVIFFLMGAIPLVLLVREARRRMRVAEYLSDVLQTVMWMPFAAVPMLMAFAPTADSPEGATTMGVVTSAWALAMLGLVGLMVVLALITVAQQRREARSEAAEARRQGEAVAPMLWPAWVVSGIWFAVSGVLFMIAVQLLASFDASYRRLYDLIPGTPESYTSAVQVYNETTSCIVVTVCILLAMPFVAAVAAYFGQRARVNGAQRRYAEHREGIQRRVAEASRAATDAKYAPRDA